MEIYAQVRHEKAREFKKFKDEYLVTTKEQVVSPLTPVGNKAIVVGEIETDPADFHHCRYNKIDISVQGESSVCVFDSEDPELRKRNPIEIDIIGGEKKSYYLDIDFDTISCLHEKRTHHKNELLLLTIPSDYEAELVAGGRIDNKIEEEKAKAYRASLQTRSTFSGTSSSSKKEVPKEQHSVKLLQNQVVFDASYPYDIPTNKQADPLTIYQKAFQYFWLPNLGDKIQRIGLRASSCAYDKAINIAIYPDIKWTLKVGFNVHKSDVEELNARGLKSPLGIFEAMEDRRVAQQDFADAADKATMHRRNDLNEIKNDEIDKTRAAFQLKASPRQTAKEAEPVTQGRLEGLIKILKRVTISLSEEHYAGQQTNELNEEFVKEFYNRYQAQFDLFVQAVEIVEGKKDPVEDKMEGLLLQQERKGKSLKGLRAKMRRKPVRYDILYPKIAMVASWFYEMVDPDKYPSLAGRQGLGVDINFSAKPLIGLSVTWDLAELLCRKHPIAYAVLKAVDALMYIIGDDDTAITCDFRVSGQIDTEIAWQHNMLAGFKSIEAKGKSALEAEIEFRINIAQTFKVLNYETILKRGFSIIGNSGIGITDVYGIDSEGMYMQKILEFEGITLEFTATVKIDVKKGRGGNRIDSLFSTGFELNGEITFLDYIYKTPKIYVTT